MCKEEPPLSTARFYSEALSLQPPTSLHDLSDTSPNATDEELDWARQRFALRNRVEPLRRQGLPSQFARNSAQWRVGEPRPEEHDDSGYDADVEDQQDGIMDEEEEEEEEEEEDEEVPPLIQDDEEDDEEDVAADPPTMNEELRAASPSQLQVLSNTVYTANFHDHGGVTFETTVSETLQTIHEE